ncbi:hypothetical protein [Streptomyces glaucescens]|uniref:Putative membrane protein n=1 Tax=Streptomyces glaucescens TaxID=1907 RepID=A0A089XKB4_STRGA|nr:hypothetical protein [Streptomyces glaucescens]AIS02377.1 putative membrane protein [Streptomyces glaucescens]
MNVEAMTTTSEQPSAAASGAAATGAAGRLFRAAVTAHTVAAFGQPVFAGVYLSGAVGGLHWHARGADIVFSLGLMQTVAGTAASVRMRRVWPVTLSLLVVAAETVQYMAGLSGALWLHLPLGAAVIASLAVLFVAAWIRPLPNAAHD